MSLHCGLQSCWHWPLGVIVGCRSWQSASRPRLTLQATSGQLQKTPPSAQLDHPHHLLDRHPHRIPTASSPLLMSSLNIPLHISDQEALENANTPSMSLSHLDLWVVVPELPDSPLTVCVLELRSSNQVCHCLRSPWASVNFLSFFLPSFLHLFLYFRLDYKEMDLIKATCYTHHHALSSLLPSPTILPGPFLLSVKPCLLPYFNCSIMLLSPF